MRTRMILAGAVCAALGACAQSSGVMKIGPDSYAVSTMAEPARGGAPGARRMALHEANAWCSKMGKEIVVTNIAAGRENVDLMFRCLATGDPDLQRPQMRSAPAAVIEDRRR